jgi:hypothetical protein
MVRARENLIGAWAFSIGVILAIIIGLIHPNTSARMSLFGNIMYAVLVILGLIVGFMKTSDKECGTFLLASLALVIASGMGKSTLAFISNISPILGYLSGVMDALLVMFIPATVIVALKTVFASATVQ